MIVHILEQGLSVPNGVKYPEWGIVLEMESSPVIVIKKGAFGASSCLDSNGSGGVSSVPKVIDFSICLNF